MVGLSRACVVDSPVMPRFLLLLAILALVVAYFKFIAFAPRDVRRKRLQWSGYTLALGLLVVVVVRTGAVSAGVLGALALTALRAAPALITWKRRLNAQQNETDGAANPDSRQAPPRKGSMSRMEALQVLELSGEPSR